ncbi:hypothetical protein B4U37_09295 [Sutcliffiella horikoshii]|uniref:DUF3592 domain-containing protein n=1 Tax=Sutcliffiella horikoshii TaxID=79883 RepID=A0ABM6KIR0_9BACI|nr:hypothetical protein [Sutcliffiella horikoshii]ART76223.1 hypothetical protein B4U37_09295 [Sutcliffiella horikoshii]
MVTAIVIPILIGYFYWITIKEAKKQKERWKNVSMVPSEARVEGTILSLHTEKKRFYHKMYILETTCRIQNHTGITTVVYKQPYITECHHPPYTNGDVLQIVGRWDGELFLAGEITLMNKKGQP